MSSLPVDHKALQHGQTDMSVGGGWTDERGAPCLLAPGEVDYEMVLGQSVRLGLLEDLVGLQVTVLPCTLGN